MAEAVAICRSVEEIRREVSEVTAVMRAQLLAPGPVLGGVMYLGARGAVGGVTTLPGIQVGTVAPAAPVEPVKQSKKPIARAPSHQGMRVSEQLNVAVGEGPVYKEKQYTITELMVLWAPRSRNYIRNLVMFEPGVVKIPGPTGQRFSYFVPESVVQRIHTRLSS
jgi:hypothetical protein